MNDHYFTSKPSAASKPVEFQAELRGRTYVFQTDTGVFSKGELDMGSRILIETMSLRRGDRVLDLGCGYGPLGLVAADLVAPGQGLHGGCERSAPGTGPENMAKNGITNAQIFVGNGIQALPPGLRFDAVLSIHRYVRAKPSSTPSQRGLPYPEAGRLSLGCDTHQARRQSLQAYLEELAGSCQTMAKKAGFRVLKCCKQLHT